jgi:hypothetical protein
MVQHLFEGHGLLYEAMAPIIDQDIHMGNLFLEARPEASVCLVTDEDSRIVILIDPALFSDIDSIHMAVLAQVAASHFEAAATVDANFHNMNRPVPEINEMLIIGGKIMAPFPHTSTGVPGIEPTCQGIRTCLRGLCHRNALVSMTLLGIS